MSTIKSSTTTTTAYSVSADTTGTLVIQTGSTPTTAVTVGTDQSVTLAGTLSLASQNMSPYTGFKNRIINGAMVIDQRNAGASGTLAAYTVDRWGYYGSQASKVTWQQNAGSVTPPTGFSNYLGVTSSSAYSVLTTDQFYLYQRIEGYNVADLAFGTASASTITFSFWVRSSLTGTFGGILTNSASNRTYPFSYTISAANTWEQKTVTVAGDTTGTWLTTSSTGIAVGFNLGTGATYSATAGAWTGTSFITAPTGAVSVVGTSGATFYITGVQLEKGSTATSFDYRPYGTELQLCQRYFFKSDVLGVGGANASNSFVTHIAFGVPMRSTPSIVAVAGTSWIISDDFNADFTAASPAVGSTYSQSSTSWRGQLTGFSGLTVGRFYGWVPAVANAISFSSEL